MTPNVELHIEHLVVPDLPGLDAPTVRAALERALTQHVAAHGVPAAWREGARAGRIDGGRMPAPGLTADGLARHVVGRLAGGGAP